MPDKILLVDDEQEIADLIEVYLKNDGYEVQKFYLGEENTAADIIDINMGCPVNKVIKAEAGAKWLLDPEKVYEMVQAVSSAVNIPVTIKMRIGWDEEHVFAV
ncbi:tRNA dihydrouridine synthase DusB, partial [Enterococcus faecium]